MKKTITFLQKNMFYFIIGLVGTAYILTGASNIIKTDETVMSIIAGSALGTVLGWLISALFGQQAIKDGYDDDELVNALNTQGKEIEKVDGDIDKLDIYCDKENEAVMIRKRTRILKKVGIKYAQFESGIYGSLLMTKRRKKAIKYASEIGFGYLTSDWLLADIDEEEERNEKKISISKYQRKQNISNLVTKIITGLVSGLFILEPFAHANWSIIIWRIFFFAMWLIFGYVRYVTDFNFITRDYRKSIVNKTNYIIKFRTSLKEHPEWYAKNDEHLITQPTKDNLSTEVVRKETDVRSAFVNQLTPNKEHGGLQYAKL